MEIVEVAERVAQRVQFLGLRLERRRPGRRQRRELIAQVDHARAQRVQRRRIVAVEGGAAAPARLPVGARDGLDDVVVPEALRSQPSRRLTMALSWAREALVAKPPGRGSPRRARVRSPRRAARRSPAAGRAARGGPPSRRDRARGRPAGERRRARRSSRAPARRRSAGRAGRSRAPLSASCAGRGRAPAPARRGPETAARPTTTDATSRARQ